MVRMLRQLTCEQSVDADDMRAVLATGVSRDQIEDALAVGFVFTGFVPEAEEKLTAYSWPGTSGSWPTRSSEPWSWARAHSRAPRTATPGSGRRVATGSR